jgi:nitrogen regulatory protein P-II 1
VDLLPKTKLELVVMDEHAGQILAAIRENAYTGDVGDGKCFVSTIDDVMRIRTGETGEAAL